MSIKHDRNSEIVHRFEMSYKGEGKSGGVLKCMLRRVRHLCEIT